MPRSVFVFVVLMLAFLSMSSLSFNVVATDGQFRSWSYNVHDNVIPMLLNYINYSVANCNLTQQLRAYSVVWWLCNVVLANTEPDQFNPLNVDYEVGLVMFRGYLRSVGDIVLSLLFPYWVGDIPSYDYYFALSESIYQDYYDYISILE